ncbi:acylphosphatase [Candidatus Woesearchaeota archaeon]|nr:acylphosphatase [Candidatus Woesearchaeota archaeon]
MMKKRIHLIIKGNVQGVFFRANAKKKAISLGLTGWVRNDPDGTVETVAEGEKSRLDEFKSWCLKGPSSAEVSDVDSETQEATGEFTTFSIRY